MKHPLWMTAKIVILSCIITTGFVFNSYATTNSENPPPAIKEHAEYLELQHMMIETAGEFDRSTGLHRFVLGSRYVNAFFEQREKLASLYQNYQNVKEPDPVLKKILIDIVNEQSTSIKSIIEKIDTLNAQDNDKQAQLEAQTDILIHEQVVARRNRILDQYLQALFVNTQYQQGLDLDHTSDVTYLEQKLQTYARYAADSVEALLDARENFLRVLGFANADVQTEINDKLQALEHKKVGAIETLAQRIQLMNSLSMDTQELSQFLVIARGKLSGDLLDADIIVGLSEQMTNALARWFSENGIDLILNIIMFFAVLLVFSIIAKLVRKVVQNALDHSNLKISALLHKFFVSMSSKLVLLIGFLIALSQLGVEVGPMLAGLGMVGFIIGFALQDTLSNFASGMMILIYRPFDEGNLIETAGVTGIVSKLSLVSTTVLTFDNQSLVIPNSKIWGDVIRNVTAQTTRRVDLVFGIGYSDDIPKAEAVLAGILDEHPKVLKNPEPMIKLHTLNESSVDFIVRPWVATSDYWDVYWDITRTVKQRFDEEGISIPFPQRDIHIYQTAIEQSDEAK
jgi:small conductance mechanosensitive channel